VQGNALSWLEQAEREASPLALTCSYSLDRRAPKDFLRSQADGDGMLSPSQERLLRAVKEQHQQEQLEELEQQARQMKAPSPPLVSPSGAQSVAAKLLRRRLS